MSDNTPIIELKNVEVTFTSRTGSLFKPNKVHAVRGVNMRIERGQTLGIVGESGCGKSTTANVMCGLQMASAGQVFFNGKEVTKRSAAARREIGRVVSVVFQDPATALNPRMHVQDQLADPLRVHGIGNEASRAKRVRELISLVGLPSSALDALPGQLSGGQRQRVAIARALSIGPDAIIADEPTSALDVSVRAQILNLLTDLKKELGLAMVFISHDIQTVRYISDRIAVMNGGKVVEEGPAAQLLADPKDPYTRKLLGAAPSPLAIPLKDGELDVPSLERHINRLIEAGLDGLFVSGSTGEVAFSTAERRAQIQREAVRIVDGRIPLLVGVIDTETERVIENIKAVEEIGGATGVVATAPFYALGGETEVERHFRLLKENTSLELWAYDIPVCVHTKLSPDLLMRLGRDGVIDGVKDSSGDDVAFRWLCLANEAAGHPMQLLTGHEVVVDGAYMSGADGSVPGLANVDPEGYVRQWQAYERRDWEAVRTEQDRLAELMRIVQVKGVQGFGAGVGAFKAALHLLGVFDSPEMPRPVAAIEGDNMEHVASVLRAVDLLS